MNKFLLEQQAGQLHGSIKTQDVTISGTFPTVIPPEPLAGRKDLILVNGTGETIYLGGEDVNEFNGLSLDNGEVFSTQLGRAKLYAVSTSTTVSGVRVMEIS